MVLCMVQIMNWRFTFLAFLYAFSLAAKVDYETFPDYYRAAYLNLLNEPQKRLSFYFPYHLRPMLDWNRKAHEPILKNGEGDDLSRATTKRRAMLRLGKKWATSNDRLFVEKRREPIRLGISLRTFIIVALCLLRYLNNSK